MKKLIILLLFFGCSNLPTKPDKCECQIQAIDSDGNIRPFTAWIDCGRAQREFDLLYADVDTMFIEKRCQEE